MERKRRAAWLILAVAAAALDLWSKALWIYPAPNRLDNNPTWFAVIEDWLYVRAVWNPGGVWSIELPPWLLLAATAIAVPLLALWIFFPPRASPWESAAKALVLGGALGNLYDRAVHGRVRDWIDVCFGDVAGRHYPTFNLADCVLVAGIAVLLLMSFVTGRKGKEAV